MNHCSVFFRLTILVIAMIFISGKCARERGPTKYLDRYVDNPFVKENVFLDMQYAPQPLPEFVNSKEMLPQPFWESHQDVIDCYWKSWEIAFGNLRQPQKNSGFVANYVTTEFNDHIFMWGHVFIFMYGIYGLQVFPFEMIFDNFYATQHPDGYICREISEMNGSEQFSRYDLSSTGPNIFPWGEWVYFQNHRDTGRLASVFPVLVANKQWVKKYHTWQNGTYFSNGWGCGMDNQPRLPEGYNLAFDHGHMSWIDITLQQIFMDKILLRMADVLDRRSEIPDIETELEFLTRFVNENMWNEKIGFYVDQYRDGTLSEVKSIGAFWALLADMVPQDRLKSFCAHLDDSDEFNRPHRIPSLSADTPGYSDEGSYWRGGVWAITNLMVLRGLTNYGLDSLSHAIALNHILNVVERFKETGTIWENYAPEPNVIPSNSRPNFVGFSGVSPITIFFEYVLGIRPDGPGNKIIWDIRLCEKHGILQYPFGEKGLVKLTCEKRNDPSEEPVITVSSNIPFTLLVKWNGGIKTIPVQADN